MDSEAQKADGVGKNASIESYLDELCAPLHDLPQDAQNEIRQEISAHLQSLMAMKREPQRVLESALQQFGDPAEIGRLLALEWENRERDLGGLSLLQRIEKIRRAVAEADGQKTRLEKRRLWLAPLIMLPILIFLVKTNASPQDIVLVRVLDVATFLCSGLLLVVCWTLAWSDWHNAPMQGKSKISRVQLALAQMAMGLFSLVPLVFFLDRSVSAYALYLLIIPGAMIVLMIGLTVFEPSRKTKLASAGSMGWSVVCGLLIIPACFRLLSAVGITSDWVQIPVVGLVAFGLGAWFWKGKTPTKHRQKVG